MTRIKSLMGGSLTTASLCDVFVNRVRGQQIVKGLELMSIPGRRTLRAHAFLTAVLLLSDPIHRRPGLFGPPQNPRVREPPQSFSGRKGFWTFWEKLQSQFQLRSEEHTSELQSHSDLVCR